MTYRERVPATRLFRGLLLVLFVVGATPLMVGAIQEQSLGLALGSLAFVVLTGVVVLWFGVLRIDVAGGELRASFGPFAKRIRVDEIAEVTVAPYRWTQYWGWGIRIRPNKRAWSVPFINTGVRIAHVSGREYYISSRAPERLRDALHALTNDPGRARGTKE